MRTMIDRLRKDTSLIMRLPATRQAIAKLREALPPLPLAHVQLLQESNGLSVYHGYFRLFGLSCTNWTDLAWWNEADTWKFSWERLELSEYLCFAEDGWGYQWAYNIRELVEKGKSKIYWLGAFQMNVTVVEESFDAFVENELLRWVSAPYNQDTINAFKRHGPLEWNNHIAYAPPLGLGGRTGNIEQTAKLPARVNMVFNGDVFVQAANESVHRPVQAVEPYFDERGRSRLRVTFR